MSWPRCAIQICVATLFPVQAAIASPVEIPFDVCDGFLHVQVNAPQSSEPLCFLVDTGAGVSVIHTPTARKLGLKLGRNATVHGVHTTLGGQWPTRIAATAAGVALPSNFLSLDLTELIHSCTHPFDGLLGMDFFRGRVVQIDFANRRLRLLRQSTPEGTDLVIPLDTSGNSFRVPVRVNGGARQWVRLDTGCVTPLEWVTTDVMPSTAGSRQAIGLTKLTIPQTETTLCLGTEEFENVPTGLHTKAIFPGESGLLGCGFLSRFKNVVIDARLGRLILSLPRAAN